MYLLVSSFHSRKEHGASFGLPILGSIQLVSLYDMAYFLFAVTVYCARTSSLNFFRHCWQIGFFSVVIGWEIFVTRNLS